jgi:uncharacterized protein (DUF2147 family)
MRFLLLAPLFLLLPLSAQAQAVAGLWRSIDDETGRPKALVRIEVDEGVLKGRIVEALDPEARPQAVCSECPTEGRFAQRGEPIVGLTIIDGLRRNGEGAWEGDDAILDPENGKVYDAKIWVPQDQSDRLKVRGYVGFFYRTQTWQRAGQ